MFGVLIVEDEEWIRRGLIRSIDWERLGLELVGEADNGARALELLRSRPVDIVLTDMKMPVCDGRKMLQSIESMGLDCEIIVLSEYSDFEYMRQAIHAHVADYLLKPVDPERLNELLTSAAAHLREKRSGPGQSDPFSRLCRAALGGSAPCPGTGLPPGGIIAVAIVLERGGNNLLAEIKTLAAGFTFESRVYPLHGLRQAFCIFQLVPEYFTAAESADCEGIFRTLHARCSELTGGDVRIGVSGKHDCADAREALTEAMDSAKYLHRGLGAVMYYDRLKPASVTRALPRASEQQLSEFLAHGRKENIPELCSSFIRPVYAAEYISAADLRKSLLDHTIMLEQCSGKAGYAVNISGLLGENYMDRIARIEWPAEAEAFLGTVLELVSDVIQEKRSLTTADLVPEIIRLIETHYMDDINLMQISQQYHINYVHLSRSFKEQTGTTFTDFLLRVRMKKAEELIERCGRSEKETASLVGYSNPYYFASSYKKYKNSLKEDRE